jgi:serine/threonine protein kinase
VYRLKDNGRFSTNDLKSAWLQLLSGFYLIQKKHCFIHNDIKPDNILFTSPDTDQKFDIEDGVSFTIPHNTPHYYFSDFGLSHMNVKRGAQEWRITTVGFSLPYALFYVDKEYQYWNDETPIPVKGPDSDLW